MALSLACSAFYAAVAALAIVWAGTFAFDVLRGFWRAWREL